MARPQRNNVDYFPFLCEDGNKMFYLEETYGNDGFAVFVKLLRELARTDYHYLNLSKNTTVMFLSAKCKVSKETLLSIISDLVDLEKFDKELWDENSIIWCQDFIDSIQDAYKKRSNNCISRNSLIDHLVSKGVCKQSKSNPKQGKSKNNLPVKPQSKEEYSKEKETIKKEILNSQSWIEDICMKKKLQLNVVMDYLNIFLDDLELKEDLSKPEKEIKQHFINWLNLNIEKLKKEKNGNRKTRRERFIETYQG